MLARPARRPTSPGSAQSQSKGDMAASYDHRVAAGKEVLLELLMQEGRIWNRFLKDSNIQCLPGSVFPGA